MRKARIKIAKPDIIQLLDDLPQRVMRRQDLSRILEKNRAGWRLTQSTTTGELITFLQKEGRLRHVRLQFPHRGENLYAWGEVSRWEIVQGLRPKGYLSHYSALELHGLTKNLPKSIYINQEQSAKPPPALPLRQDRIDLAFRNQPRTSRTKAVYESYAVYILNGKQSGDLGVTDYDLGKWRIVRVTGLERTLIDAAVRPHYAGGVHEVCEAFRRASGRVSTNHLVSILKRLDYRYPYQQAIGFYMEASGGFRESALKMLEESVGDFDFYLVHGTKGKNYSRRWRIYYPDGLM